MNIKVTFINIDKINAHHNYYGSKHDKNHLIILLEKMISDVPLTMIVMFALITIYFSH